LLEDDAPSASATSGFDINSSVTASFYSLPKKYTFFDTFG